MPTTSGGTWVEKEKWKMFKKTWGSSGAAAGGRIGRQVDYRLGIVNDIVGIVVLGIQSGDEGKLTVVGDHLSY
jgi:hypothetical protein